MKVDMNRDYEREASTYFHTMMFTLLFMLVPLGILKNTFLFPICEILIFTLLLFSAMRYVRFKILAHQQFKEKVKLRKAKYSNGN